MLTSNFKIPPVGFCAIAFAVLLCDSAFSYFTRPIIGFTAVNIDVPIILLIITAGWSYRSFVPPAWAVIAIACMSVGFIIGIYNIGLHDKVDFNSYRFIPLFSAIAAFLLGFFSFRWHNNIETYSKAFAWIGIIYSVICVVALLGLAPRFFPVINSLWSDNGIIRKRPEVTTDQNFQIFYLLPGVLLLALPFRLVRGTIASLLTVAALYSLAQLQTRSGTFALFATILLCTIAPFWTPSLGKEKVFWLPALSLLVALINLDLIVESSSLLIERITNLQSDTSFDYSTGIGRLSSFLYLFDHLSDPTWWVLPQGYNEFFKLHNTIPHSNITAMFLEAGIFGLLGWIILFLVPVIKLSILFFKKRLDELATLIFIGTVAVLTIQLSLNVPLMDQVWLWAGAAVGTLERIKNTPSESQSTKNKLNNTKEIPENFLRN